MKTIFDRNLNALKKKNRKLYNAAVNKECKKQEKIIRICKNEKKQDVLSVYKKEHLWYLSSRYDSEYAAEEWVKQFKDMHYKNIFIVYGMSQGDYIKSLQKVIGEDNKVIVYEPDENIYFSVINNVDITKWIADDRVQLYVGNINEDEFRLYFRYEIKYELLELTNVISSPNYAKVYCDEYEKFTSLIDNESRYVIGERQTLNVSGQEFGDNIIKNIWELAKGSSLYYLKDIINSKIECLDNIPAIIVSAGPSLDKNIDDIKLSKGKAFIVAVDSAINKLLEHDIEPDLLVTVDSHKPMNLFAKEKVKNMNRQEQIIFTGFISDVDKLMSITDVQANASFGTEATSLALLEGMSLGIPAVVSDFGGNPGVIKNGQNGYIVPKQNSKALADNLEVLLTDQKLYDYMSQGAKKIFQKTFTAQAMTKQTEQVYLDLMK